MSSVSRVFGAFVVGVALVGSGFGLAMVTPNLITGWSYAVERGQAEAAQVQLEQPGGMAQAFTAVAKSLRPSVVSVSSVTNVRPRAARPEMRGFRNRQVPNQLPEELREFFGGQAPDQFQQFGESPERGMQQRGVGSGVIVSPEGFILTNNHVVRGADEVSVTLSDGRIFKAKVVGGDDKSDLAVIQIKAAGLVAAKLGDSDSLEVGQWAVAIGSPFGLDQTVTAGIISAKGRSVGINDYEDFLQTDAAINPGNSGGPLVNLKGEVIGINTAIASRSGGYQGVGFAIPSNMASSVMHSIITSGTVERGWLGAAIQDLNEELAKSFQFEGTGVLIGDVVAGSPAEKSGMKAGDIVTSYQGKPTLSANQLRNSVAATTPGTKAKLEVYREGKAMALEVPIGKLETTKVSTGSNRSGSAVPELGLTLGDLTAENAREAGADERLRGALVEEVEQGSLAARVGLRAGDVIVSVDSTPVPDAASFHRLATKENVEKGMRLQIVREGTRRFVYISAQ